MADIRSGLMRLTGLDKILRQEMAVRAQLGGISTQMIGSDDLVGDLAVIEEALSQFNMITRMHRERKMRYRDYDAMDNYGDVSVALDIYAEEATQQDLIKETNLWVTGDSKAVRDVEEVITRLRLRTMIQGFARNLAKYGDMFLHQRYTYQGLDRILFLPPQYVQRVGPSVDLVKFYKVDQQIAKVSPRQDGMLLPWECAHFRMLSFGFSTMYGRAIIEPARKRWLHLKLLEDSVAIYRLNRAVERIVYYIDVGAASPTDGLRIVNQYKRKFGNKRSYINPDSDTFEQQYDPHHMLENLFWPVNSATERSRIEKLPAPPEQGQLQDLDHFNEKLYVALGIPRDYLTGEVSGAWNSREALALQDVRFSRKLHRLQVSLLEGLEIMLRFHLAVKWGDADAAKAAKFTLHLADVSKIARQQYDQILLNRVQLMQLLNDLGTQMNFNRDVWVKFILESYYPDLDKSMIEKLVIPDEALRAAQTDLNQDQIDMQTQLLQNKAAVDVGTAQATAGLQSKGDNQKNKSANEDFRSRVLNDLKARDLVEEEMDVVGELLENWTPSDEAHAMTLENHQPPAIPIRWLNEAIKSVRKDGGKEVVLTEEK
jgi:hypothetical protein